MTDSPQKLTPGDLAALMCARICHDLVSPVGALGTALEVLDDPANTDMHADALDLVRLSARQASSKLQFLRLAFGAGTSAPGFIGMDHVRGLVENMYGEGKATFAWNAGCDGLGKAPTRLLLNLVMIGTNCIPRGGEITINVSQKGDADLIEIKATGPRARLDDMVTRTLTGKAPEDGFDGRSIQPFYAGMIIREIKGRIDASIQDETVTLSAFAPQAGARSAA